MHLSSVNLATRLLQTGGTATLLLSLFLAPAASAPLPASRSGSLRHKVTYAVRTAAASSHPTTHRGANFARARSSAFSSCKLALQNVPPVGGADASGQLFPAAASNTHPDARALLRAIQHRNQMSAGSLSPVPGHSVENVGHAWQFVGPKNYSNHSQLGLGIGPVSGPASAVAVDPASPRTIYAASPTGGVWKSLNGGATWTFLSWTWPSLQVSCLAVGPNNTVYAGTGDFDQGGGYTFGLMKSADGGTTWVNLGAAQFGNVGVSRIVVDPEHPNVVLVTTGRGQGGFGAIWRSLDGGQTWTQPLNQPAIWTDIAYSIKTPEGRRYYYAAGTFTSNNPAGTGTYLGGIWRSQDRGATWVKLGTPSRYSAQPNRLQVATSQTDPYTVYFASSFTKKIYQGTLAGLLWNDITAGFPVTDAIGADPWVESSYDFTFAAGIRMVAGTPQDVLLLGLRDIFQYLNVAPYTNEWGSINKTFTGNDLSHVNQHDIIFNPAAPNQSFVANDGGVYSFNYDPASNSWSASSLNATLNIAQVWDAAFAPRDPNTIVLGLMLDSSPQTIGDPNVWSMVTSGNGGACVINPDDPTITYTSIFNPGLPTPIFRNAIDITPPTTSTSGDLTSIYAPQPLTLDPNNADLLYYATNFLYYWDDTLATWTKLGQKLSATSWVQSVSVAQGDDNRIYTGSFTGEIWMTKDAGATWAQINTGLPTLPVSAISINPRNPGDIVVTLAGIGAPHVWRCANTTAATITWTSISGTGKTALPDFPTNTIARDIDDNQNTFYIGTDFGVFFTQDGGTTWKDGTRPLHLPSAQITDLKAITGTRYLNVATFGLGLWRVPLVLNDKLLALRIAPTSIVGTSAATGTVTLRGVARAGGTIINLSSSDTTVAAVPSAVVVPQGLTSQTFPIGSLAVTKPTTVIITATQDGITSTAKLTVTPAKVVSLSLNPSNVRSTATSTATVTLDGPAPPGGASVALASSDKTVATVPASVLVRAGTSSVTFPVTSLGVTQTRTAKITATYGGATSSAVLTVSLPQLTTLTVNPTTVVGGNLVVGRVTLDGRAVGNVVVRLASSYDDLAHVPATVTILNRERSAQFIIRTRQIPEDGTVNPITITSTLGNSVQSAQLSVTSAQLVSLTLNPSTVTGGTLVTGTVTLNSPAAAGGYYVTLTSSNPAVAQVPVTITVPAGRTSTTFNIFTSAITAQTMVTITGSHGGNVQAVLTVNP